MNLPVDTSSATNRYFGRSIKRREDPKYLTGQSQYTDDLTPSGTLSAAIVRSPYAHARIVGITVEEARKRPDVVAIYTGADLRDRMATLPCTWILPGMKVPVHPVLAFETVRYVGDGVAVVVAEDRYAAADALDAIQIDYEPLEVVTNQEHAMQPGAATIHRKRVTVEGAPCNPAMIAQGLWMAACAVKINWRACKFSWLPREVIDRYEDGAVGWYSSATEGEWCTWLQAPRLAWHCSFPSEFAMPAPSAEDRARLEPLLAPTRQYCSVSFYSNTPAIAIPGKT